MNVVGSNIRCPKIPLADLAGLANGFLYQGPSPGSKFDWGLGQQPAIMFPPGFIMGNSWRAKLIMKAINGPSFITMKPRAISSKCYQVTQWNAFVRKFIHLRSSLYRTYDPVATAPGSVFVVPICKNSGFTNSDFAEAAFIDAEQMQNRERLATW